MKRSTALEPLSHDHYEGLQMAARLRRARRDGDAAAPWAEAVGAFWRDHLVPHFADEEAVVLPLLREAAAPLADRMRDEHRSIGALVARIEAEPAGWEGPLGTVAGVLAARLRFEEREAFPAAERLASAEAIARVGEQLRDATLARPTR